jgi:hypothetical protein
VGEQEEEEELLLLETDVTEEEVAETTCNAASRVFVLFRSSKIEAKTIPPNSEG